MENGIDHEKQVHSYQISSKLNPNVEETKNKMVNGSACHCNTNSSANLIPKKTVSATQTNGTSHAEDLNGRDCNEADVTVTNGVQDRESYKNGELPFDSVSIGSSDVDTSSKGYLHPKISSSSGSDEESDFDDVEVPRRMYNKKPWGTSVLEWNDMQHHEETIHHMNVFRKNKQFCDLIIQVGGKELHCHRVIVGAMSKAIYNELCGGEQECGPVARIPLNHTQHSWVPEAVEILIDYMYTSKLTVPPNLVTAVYKACCHLRVDRVTPICRKHIVSELCFDECVFIRRLASSVGDMELKNLVDAFIEENFETVATCNAFFSLPRIKMEISLSSSSSLAGLLSLNWRDGSALCSSAISWIFDTLQLRGGSYLEELTEQVQRITSEELYNTAASHNGAAGRKFSLDSDRGWHGDVNGRHVTAHSARLSRSSSMDSLTSSESEESAKHLHSNVDGEWKLISHSQTPDHITALCCAGDVLCALTIHLPPNSDLQNGTHDSASHHSNSAVSSASASCSSSVGSVSHLASLSQARCAAGVAELDGKIYAVGGYNQSECLDTVECFDSGANRWSGVCRLNERRARFAAAVLDDQLYAVGGSSGSQDQISVERYDPARDVWSHVAQLLTRCSESGVAVLNGRLYCVGGVQQSTGVAGMKVCQVYDPAKDKWEYASSMHTGRSSLGVAALGGFLYAAGGSDGWSCLSSVERYDPSINAWGPCASLLVPRRGLGMIAHNGALYCVGGFDGHSFLATVERFAPDEGDVWCHVTASLNMPRNNAGLASLNGGLFVVGGYSGRHFLSSMEIFDEAVNEWTNDEHQAALGSAAVVEPDSN